MKLLPNLIAITILASSGVCAQTMDQNHIVQQTMLDSIGCQSITTVDYFDGLGRKVQSVKNGILPGNASQFLLQRTTYDMAGREYQNYLPVSVHGLSYHPDLLYKYNDQNAMSVKTYDVLGRPVNVSTPGNDMDGRSKQYRYGTNLEGSVNHYITESDSLSQCGSYSPGTLSCQQTTDEDGHVAEVYTDLLGQKVLERHILNNRYTADTYFVYNDCGRLCFILQPKFQREPDVSMYAFRYQYDSLGRMIEKTLPGCKKITYTYDDADRLLSMQDGAMRIHGTFLHHTYDSFSRLKTQTYNFEDRVVNILQWYYYDGDYSFINSCPVPLTNVARNLLAYSNEMGQTSGNDRQLGNTLTSGQIQRASDGTYTVTAQYYNSKGLMVEKNVKMLGDHLRREQFTYTFTGQILVHTTIDYEGVNEVFRSEVSNNYDSSTGLLTSTDITTSVNSSEEVTRRTSSYEYDNYGRISNETHGSAHQSKTYDVRDWPTKLSSSNFTETLTYTGRKYNGNINDIRYSGTDFDYTYQFWYDPLNRLTDAEYLNHREPEEWWAEPEFSEYASYDLNGNITRIQRIGFPDEGVPPYLIDDLKLSYNGNQLKSVFDDEDDHTYMITGNFMQNSTDSLQYTYNANGAQVSDANKGIVYTEYDTFGYPRTIYFSNGCIIKYVYTPEGQKLRTTYTTSVPYINKPMGYPFHLASGEILSVTTQDYWGTDIVCTNEAPSRYLFEGGYADITGDGMSWHYFVKDHLGSTRIVQNEQGMPEARYNYYPYGGIFKHFGEIYGLHNIYQPYKYSGKEYDPRHGLNLYDFGARMYDPLLARWTAIDPLAEKCPQVSPYAFCLNNPVNRVDKDGKFSNKHSATIAHCFNRRFLSVLGQETGPIQENINATDENMRFYFDTFSVDNLDGTDTGDNGIVITQEYSMDKSFVETIGEIGAGIEMGGLGLTMTGVGAPIGGSVAYVGAKISTAATICGIGIDLINGDIVSALGSGVIWRTGVALGKGIDKLLPDAKVGPSAEQYTSGVILEHLKNEYMNCVQKALDMFEEERKE